MVINSTLQLTLQHHQTQLTGPSESIYHTFHFVFAVRPEVNFDVHPCGLNRICEHPRATEFTQRLTGWCVTIIAEKNAVPPSSQSIVVPGRIHALMMASNVSAVMSDRCKTGVPNSHLTPTKTHNVTDHNYTFAC